MTIKVGQVVDNRYRVASMLGQGGMGAVYRAWDTRLNRPVALKELVPQPGLGAEMLVQLCQQFEQEAQVLATLFHPRLVRVTDYFSWESGQYLVMDFVEGQSLADRIDQQGSQTEVDLLRWASQLLDGLSYCHKRGVIHRDIKPQNLIITPEGNVVLVDFGLVKLWDPDDPHTRTVMRGAGSPQYAPPEQYDIGMGHTGPRSDIYSLGATLYHVVTGQTPPTATQRMANPSGFVPPRQINAALSPHVGAAILKAMEVAMHRRFQSATEMAQALAPPAQPTFTRRLAPSRPAAIPQPEAVQRGKGSTLVAPQAQPGAKPKPKRKAGFWIGLAVAGVLCLALVACGAFVVYLASVPDAEPIIVEVTAMHTVEAAATHTPGQATVRVAPDGSGDYPSLEAAVDAVAPGSTINLDAGTYRLAEPLDIDKPLNLVGAGMDQTEIVSAADGHVIRFSGDGPFGAADITFRHEGTAVADVAVVRGGEVTFSRCRFTGAFRGGEDQGRAGLRIEGNTTGFVQDCEAVENDTNGIRVVDQAQPTLVGNVCSDNTQIGIHYLEDAAGAARQNECLRNGRHGIAVRNQAHPTLEENTCTDNEQFGICFSDDASGVARRNLCMTNGLSGIIVREQAQPTLENNITTINEQSGIVYFADSGGAAIQNDCSGNGLRGISVNDQAQPTLDRNVCESNAKAGISYFDNASGMAIQNDCSGNGWHGISVHDQAQPTLDRNVCENNTETGIGYFENASGTAIQNECSGNEWGIYVAETASPQLIDNNCHDNSTADVDDRRP